MPVRARTVAGLAGASAAGGLLLLALVVTGWPPLRRADHALSDALHRAAHAEPGWTRASRVMTDWVWDPVTMRLLAAAAVLVLLARGARRPAGWVATAVLGGAAVQYGLKAAVGRARPEFPDPVDSASYHAFPSGHVMTATIVCAVLLALVLPRLPHGGPWRTAAWALALVSVVGVGLTRAHLGVHWPTDVAAGWLFGTAVAAVSALPFRPWLRRRPGAHPEIPAQAPMRLRTDV
ncbi:phosphatase PAP2 family protein [Streptomyces sp. TRM 70351]|uniref:phosphatase PAP2 family protein n=1 Tax=Streptomyces sp. TRM 70351 TaxID=3116552 RepID=UPI002E7BC740|nr:phosphatase PAP2 family protein [Streptomyces sp. TRM 70351]MEE1928952.1 phosphatase PAP2 family protein [Streptomyces sp. TRM 70351]